MEIFDRALVRRRRMAAAASFDSYAFLYDRAAQDIVERLSTTTQSYPLVLDMSSRKGRFLRAVQDEPALSQRIDTVVAMDYAKSLLARGPSVVADEEALPFAPMSFSLAVNLLSLHAVNDIPGALLQIRHVLKSGGLFLAALFGGKTLFELRSIMAEAESETSGGASPRIAPFMMLADAAGLLGRAGFVQQVADSDQITATYENAFALMRDIRGMGEANSLLERRRVPLCRATLQRTAELYADRHARPDGRISASFEILYLTGWAP